MISLFMAYPLDAVWESQIPPKLWEILVSGGDYLEKISYNEGFYLAKKIPPLPSIDEINNIKKNIISLLKRFIPDYPFNQERIIIFSIHGKFNS